MSGRFQFQTMYRVTSTDDGTRCPNGHRLALLSARCVTKMPAFYVCFTCRFVGEIGVGVVSKGRASNKALPKRRGD